MTCPKSEDGKHEFYLNELTRGMVRCYHCIEEFQIADVEVQARLDCPCKVYCKCGDHFDSEARCWICLLDAIDDAEAQARKELLDEVDRLIGMNSVCISEDENELESTKFLEAFYVLKEKAERRVNTSSSGRIDSPSQFDTPRKTHGGLWSEDRKAEKTEEECLCGKGFKDPCFKLGEIKGLEKALELVKSVDGDGQTLIYAEIEKLRGKQK